LASLGFDTALEVEEAFSFLFLLLASFLSSETKIGCFILTCKLTLHLFLSNILKTVEHNSEKMKHLKNPLYYVTFLTTSKHKLLQKEGMLAPLEQKGWRHS
jgi:hypothetical protein